MVELFVWKAFQTNVGVILNARDPELSPVVMLGGKASVS